MHSRRSAAVHYLVQASLYGHSGVSLYGCAVAYMLEQHEGGMKRLQKWQQETLNCLLGVKLHGCPILLAQQHQQQSQYRVQDAHVYTCSVCHVQMYKDGIMG